MSCCIGLSHVLPAPHDPHMNVIANTLFALRNWGLVRVEVAVLPQKLWASVLEQHV